MGSKLTKEIVNSRIIDRGIIMIGDYTNDGVKTLFRCDHGHEWNAVPKNILRGKGCPHCYGTAPLTTQIVNERISHKGFTMNDEYTTAHAIASFTCDKGHTWRASVNSVMRSSGGCPRCSKCGFNISKPAFGYLLNFDFCIKYGITNNLDQRLKQLSRTKRNYEVVATKFYSCGTDALSWERKIKQDFGGNFVTKKELNAGWTETLSPKMIEEILTTMKEKQ